MATPIRVFGTGVVVPSGGITMNFSMVVWDGVNNVTLSVVDAAMPVIPAGTYSPTGFLVKVGKLLRKWIFDAVTADPAVSNPALVADVNFTIGLPDANLISGVNSTLVSFSSAALGCNIIASGLPARLKSWTIDNTLGWACLLGVHFGTAALVFQNLVYGTATIGTFTFQPRYLFTLKGWSTDTGDEEELPGLFGDQVGDGSVHSWEFGARTFTRQIAIVSQSPNICGPAYVVGTGAGTFVTARNKLDLLTQDETVLFGMAGTYSRTDGLSSGQYLRAGSFWARFFQVAGSSYETRESWPLAITPEVGSPIQVISEANALILEWIRTKCLFPYEPVDSTFRSSWISKCYAPLAKGSTRIEHKRRDNANALYTMSLMGRLNRKPGLVVP